MTATLQTARLALAPVDVGDFDDLCALMSDEAFTRFVLPSPLGPEDVWLRLLRDIGDWRALGYGNWTVRMRDTGAFAGVVGVLNFRRAIKPPLGPYELGWGVAPALWKQGIGLEALQAALSWCDGSLGAARTVCIIDPDSTRPGPWPRASAIGPTPARPTRTTRWSFSSDRWARFGPETLCRTGTRVAETAQEGRAMHTRRTFGMLTVGGLLAAATPEPPMGDRPRRAAIMAPSNLGLRPLRPGHIPGAWRAPEALEVAGLLAAVVSESVVRLERPAYRTEASPGSRIRNGPAIRRFNEQLAEVVSGALSGEWFPVVIGGNCSILLGCLAGARGAEPIGLVHVDGHSDFYHPGNYDSAARLGSAAGMDLALATGRGEPLLADWGGTPLVDDVFVSQIGERDELDPDYDYRDIETTRIRRFPIRAVKRSGLADVVSSVLAPVAGRQPGLWLHVDLDVLDAKIMAAVDSPGSPGFSFAELAELLGRLLASGRIIGLDVTIYDPDLDPDGRHAPRIVDCLAEAFAWRG